MSAVFDLSCAFFRGLLGGAAGALGGILYVMAGLFHVLLRALGIILGPQSYACERQT